MHILHLMCPILDDAIVVDLGLIMAAAAVDRILVGCVLHIKEIVASTAEDAVVPVAAIDAVVAIASLDGVVPIVAVNRVVPAVALDGIASVVAANAVRRLRSKDRVVAIAAVDGGANAHSAEVDLIASVIAVDDNALHRSGGKIARLVINLYR